MKSLILASSRNDNRLELVFVKNQAFVNLILKIIGKFVINWEVFHNYDERIGKKIVEKIKDIEDELYHFEDKYLKIDIFVGYKKVILVLFSSEKLQQDILNEIIVNSEWKKIEKILT